MSDHLSIAAVVKDGKIEIVDRDFYLTRSARFAKKVGDGCMLRILIMEEEEAAKHSHYKHLFGHLLGPASEFNGDTVDEWKERVKALFLPDGMVSLTEMSAVQFEGFNKSVEQYIRENLPEAWDRCCDAMALYDNRRAS
jgi:hypothetical protein